jgi:hypothetical protein
VFGTALALIWLRIVIRTCQQANYFLETLMNTQTSTKFAALVLAVMMNSLILGAVALLFSGPMTA